MRELEKLDCPLGAAHGRQPGPRPASSRRPSEEQRGGSLPPTQVHAALACVQPAPTGTNALRRLLLSRCWCSWGRRVGD
eukprot:355384-Chlamydomonas_euryale.AAC.5